MKDYYKLPDEQTLLQNDISELSDLISHLEALKPEQRPIDDDMLYQINKLYEQTIEASSRATRYIDLTQQPPLLLQQINNLIEAKRHSDANARREHAEREAEDTVKQAESALSHERKAIEQIREQRTRLDETVYRYHGLADPPTVLPARSQPIPASGPGTVSTPRYLMPSLIRETVSHPIEPSIPRSSYSSGASGFSEIPAGAHTGGAGPAIAAGPAKMPAPARQTSPARAAGPARPSIRTSESSISELQRLKSIADNYKDAYMKGEIEPSFQNCINAVSANIDYIYNALKDTNVKTFGLDRLLTIHSLVYSIETEIIPKVSSEDKKQLSSFISNAKQQLINAHARNIDHHYKVYQSNPTNSNLYYLVASVKEISILLKLSPAQIAENHFYKSFIETYNNYFNVAGFPPELQTTAHELNNWCARVRQHFPVPPTLAHDETGTQWDDRRSPRRF